MDVLALVALCAAFLVLELCSLATVSSSFSMPSVVFVIIESRLSFSGIIEVLGFDVVEDFEVIAGVLIFSLIFTHYE